MAGSKPCPPDCTCRKHSAEVRARSAEVGRETFSTKNPMASPESRARLSAAAKRRWADPAEREAQSARLRRLSNEPERRAKLSASMRETWGQPGYRETRSGENHPAWQGDDAKADVIHDWLIVRHPKTGTCEHCGKTPEPHTDRLGRVHAGTHYAFLRHPEPHTRNRADYVELCVACHKRMDAEHLSQSISAGLHRYHDSGQRERG